MPGFSEIAASLNPEQANAAQRLWHGAESALQVIAGAGSGKTTTLVAAFLAACESGINTNRIAVITFSRRAAGELKVRFRQHGVEPGYCGTMHALAWRLLRKSGFGPKLLLHAARTQAVILRRLFPAYDHIPEKALLSDGFLKPDQRAALHSAYTAYLQENNLTDFEAMIARVTREKLGLGAFDALLVDEYQDTSPDQVEFLRSFGMKKLFVVGDDWQSIYRFRGADVALTQNFTRHFDNAARSYLVRNYRSGKPIVKLGNRVIRESGTFMKKNLVPVLPVFHKPVLFFAADATSAEEVWNRYLTFCGNAHGKLGEPLQKVTVLVRTNALRRLLETQLPRDYEVLTIHKSKGLEFDNVIVFGIAEHILPHRDSDFDEEVRILYVALTRARRFLGFIGWEAKSGRERSAFLPLLMQRCRLVYLRAPA